MFPPRQSPPSPPAASLANYLFFHGIGFRLRVPIERRTSLRRFDDRTPAESTFLVHATNIEIIMEPRNLGLWYVCHSCLARLVKALFPFLFFSSPLVSFLFCSLSFFVSRPSAELYFREKRSREISDPVRDACLPKNLRTSAGVLNTADNAAYVVARISEPEYLLHYRRYLRASFRAVAAAFRLRPNTCSVNTR